jgi:uroporphyrinogen-III synthase
VAGGALAGCRVLITRPREGSEALIAQIEAQGGRTIVQPMLMTAPPEDRQPLAAALARLAQYDWLIFTSGAGVDAVPAAALPIGRPTPRLAAVGAATAEALRKRGATSVWQPAAANGASLAHELPAARGARALMLRSDLADPATAQALAARGIVVEDVIAYRTIPRGEPAPEIRAALRQGDLDAILLASPSAVHGLVASCGRDPALYGRVALVSMGPTTSRAIEALGLSVAAQAERPSTDALVAALIDHQRSSHGR